MCIVSCCVVLCVLVVDPLGVEGGGRGSVSISVLPLLLLLMLLRRSRGGQTRPSGGRLRTERLPTEEEALFWDYITGITVIRSRWAPVVTD